jgi:hypothetical protein
MHPAWYINSLCSAVLEGLLFWRASRCQLWRHYPFFYAYLMYTALWSLFFSLPLVIHSSAYAKAFWLSYLVAAIMRFGIAVEIHRYVFPRRSPLRSRASVAVLLVLMLLASVFWIAGPGAGHFVFPDVMRKITVSLAAWVLVVLGLARYYGTRSGRNVWGMAVGILLFTGSELVYLAAMDLVPSLWTVWRYVHPITFVLALMVWTSALWRFYPNPRVPALDKPLAQELLLAWRDRWTQVPNLVRKVVKS